MVVKLNVRKFFTWSTKIFHDINVHKERYFFVFYTDEFPSYV